MIDLSRVFYSVVFLVLLCAVLFGCNQNVRKSYAVIQGEAMGTYYRVTCNCHSVKGLQYSIDSLINDINSEVSTYEPDSYISKISKAAKGTRFTDAPKHFDVNLKRALYWYEASNGYLDVSIMPLVNYWGFGYTPKNAVRAIDSIKVDSLMQLIGLDKWTIDSTEIIKNLDGQQLDFSSLAKGYAVDQMGELLLSKGCSDYLIDIGGEMVAKGANDRGDDWVVGISTPDPDAAMNDLELAIKISDKALASSGNYRIFHEIQGKKYGHTLNPLTGYPYQDELLAVSIIADECIDADAIATSCMALGYRKAATFIADIPQVSACFLVGAEDGSIQTIFANGFIRYVLQ